MEETERNELLQKIERQIDDLVESSKKEGLDTFTLTKDNNYIETACFVNSEGKEYIKVSTKSVEAILPIHSYNSNFKEISDKILNNNINNCQKVHKYNTRNKNNYVKDPISLILTEPVDEWSDSDEFRRSMGSVIEQIGNILKHLYRDCDDISPDDYPQMIFNYNYMVENNQLMLYGEASSLLYAAKNGYVHGLIDNILSLINEIPDDISSPPPPVRFTMKEFKEILPIINAKREHTIHTCAICMEDIKVRSRICMTKCGHCFHSRCLRRWLVNKCQTPQCPCCRECLLDETSS